MPTRSDAEEHLRIIRSLMEKATIYRAISAPTALVGGASSVLLGAWLHFRWMSLPTGREEVKFSRLFICGWLGVLALTCVANTWFLWRDARRRGEPFISAGMKQALKCLAPPLLCGGFGTFCFAVLRSSEIFFLPAFWMISYGLALLATAPFAPRSIPRLGWFFLFAGFATTFGQWSRSWVLDFLEDEFRIGQVVRYLFVSAPVAANLLMVATFGLFHLAYARFTWPRWDSRDETGGTP